MQNEFSFELRASKTKNSDIEYDMNSHLVDVSSALTREALN